MAHLFVDTPGAHISKSGEAISIHCDGTRLVDTPIQEVDHVTLVGNVQITSQAMRAFARRGVRVAVLGSRGNLDCTIGGHSHKHAELRLAQYGKYRDNAYRLNLGKIVVWSKLKNCLDLVQKHHRSHHDLDCSHEESIIQAEMRRVWQTGNRDEILGCEGNAAHSYYAVFARMIRHDGFTMKGRTRRPPRDPVNALLSLGYTLLYNEIHAALEGIGLDPYIGFLHEVEYGRASLACDLMEEFRFLIDALVLSVINRRMIEPSDFSLDEATGGWMLSPSGRKTYYQAYDQKMRTELQHQGQSMCYRRVFSHHAAAFARVIRDEEYVYTPFEAR